MFHCCDHFLFVSGNSDDSSVVKNRLPAPIIVKLIRIVPVLEEDSPISLRIEVFGCGEGSISITTPLASTEGIETTITSEGTTTAELKTTPGLLVCRCLLILHDLLTSCSLPKSISGFYRLIVNKQNSSNNTMPIIHGSNL